MSRISMSYFYLLLMSVFCSCFSPINERAKDDLVPNYIVQLPHELDEVSGLAFDKDSNLIAVNDELGIVYTLDSKTGDILSKFTFKKEGDFEGIAVVQELTYVLESDGDLFELNMGTEKTKYDLFDDKDFEFEGLCRAKHQSLLLACKHHKNKEKDKEYIWLYGFDLKKKMLQPEPYLKLKRTAALKNFKPSAIDFNFRSNELFILSAATRQLLVVNENKSIKEIYPLNYSDAPQAEGILLDQKGGLFVATERNTFEFAKLLYFEAKNF